MYGKLCYTDGRLLLNRHTTVPSDTETVYTGNTDGKLPFPRHTTVPTDIDLYLQKTLTANCRSRGTQLYLLILTYIYKKNTDGKLPFPRHTTVPTDNKTVCTGNSGILTAYWC